MRFEREAARADGGREELTGNAFVVYEISRHVLPTAPSPKITHMIASCGEGIQRQVSHNRYARGAPPAPCTRASASRTRRGTMVSALWGNNGGAGARSLGAAAGAGASHMWIAWWWRRRWLTMAAMMP